MAIDFKPEIDFEPEVSNINTFDSFEPETQDRIKDTLFYSTISDSDPNDVYDFVPEIKEQEKGSRYEDAIRAFAKGFANAGSAIQRARIGILNATGKPGGGPVYVQTQTPEFQAKVEEKKKELRQSSDMLWEITKSPELAMTNDDIFADATDMIGQTFGYIGATVTGGIIAGPPGAFAVGTIMEGNNTYMKAKDTFKEQNNDAPLTPEQEVRAINLGIAGGLAKGSIEGLGFGSVEKLFGIVSKKLTSKLLGGVVKFTGATVAEALEEGSQELVDIGLEKTYKDVDWNEAVTRTLASMAGGAFLGGAVKGGGIALRRALINASENTQAITMPETTDKGETPSPDISGSVDFTNRENLPEEIPDVTDEQITKALGIEETPPDISGSVDFANRENLPSDVTVPQETQPVTQTEPSNMDVTQETTPVSESKTQEVLNVNTLQERDILGGEDPIQVIAQNLKKAKQLVPVIEAEQKATQKERFRKMEDVANELIEKYGLTPSQALNIARMQLSGQQTEYNRRFESIRERLEQSSPGTVQALELSVWNSPELQLMDKNDLIVALNKLIDGHYLQKNEIKKIRDFFGDALGDIAETRIKNIPWYEQLVDMWRAGLLTGVKTSGLNLVSNFSHAITETASDNVAAGIDAFISKITGKDRTIAATVRGEIQGLMKKGIPEFKHYMKTGVDNRNIGNKYDYTERSYGNGKWAKFRLGYVNAIFHLLGAEDMLFYYATEGRSYYNQALADGINKGLSGKELTDYADNLATHPTEKMIEIGIVDAETAVFMNKTAIGDLASQLQKFPVLGKIIVPFSRTPAAIGMQIINYTPVGVAKEVIQQIHKGKFDQRRFSQASGRSIVGTAALVIGAELLKAGLMTLAYPKGERERKLWELEGRKPFSIKVGNKWRSIYVLGPAGNILIVGGYFQKAYEETGSPTEAMTVALFGGAKSIAEQTFLRGLNQALTAVSDPELSWNRWFSDMAGSAVPTIIADFARATDTAERRAEGPIEKIANRLPFTREMLQPKLDVFGQDLPRYGGNPLEVMIDPTRPVKINQDLVVDELRRLWDKDVKVSPTLLGDRMGYDILSDEENTVLWRNAGRMVYGGLFSMMMSSEYKNETDEGKGEKIEELVKDAKDLARAEMSMSKMSEGYTETKLRKGGLLTNDVKKLIGD